MLALEGVHHVEAGAAHAVAADVLAGGGLLLEGCHGGGLRLDVEERLGTPEGLGAGLQARDHRDGALLHRGPRLDQEAARRVERVAGVADVRDLVHDGGREPADGLVADARKDVPDEAAAANKGLDRLGDGGRARASSLLVGALGEALQGLRQAVRAAVWARGVAEGVEETVHATDDALLHGGHPEFIAVLGGRRAAPEEEDGRGNSHQGGLRHR
mmetsp:Transcript_77620/g.240489  ORF Transcript_77620/g.240489 Transcript_77620/m.240489 type:complete len:215 (+) Transcript_77620:389-1033(+)